MVTKILEFSKTADTAKNIEENISWFVYDNSDIITDIKYITEPDLKIEGEVHYRIQFKIENPQLLIIPENVEIIK